MSLLLSVTHWCWVGHKILQKKRTASQICTHKLTKNVVELFKETILGNEIDTTCYETCILLAFQWILYGPVSIETAPHSSV